MAVVVPVISTFDERGITAAIKAFKKLDTDSKRAGMVLLSLDKGLSKLAINFGKVAGVAAGVGGVIGSQLAQAAYESRKVMAQTGAIINATGGAANVTSEQVAKLSRELSMQAGIDDELIQKSANILLTFKQVQNQTGKNNDIFNQAVRAAVDLGNVFGSTDAAALQLGKALSDPVRGVTALRRAGINFTEQQKQQIKALVESGRTLDAQKLILREVESQVGGTAAATATGFDKMRVAMDNVAETLGDLLIPYIERFSNFVINSVVPTMDRFAQIVGTRGIGAGLEYMTGKIINGISNMGTLGKTIMVVVGAFTAVRVAAVTFSATMTALNIVTTLSNGALSTLITRLGATKIAMLAAGGVTTLLSIAALMYGQYASQKAKAVDQTRNLVDALMAEGAAQSTALKDLTKNNSQFKIAVASLADVGLSFDDVSQYINTGKGKFKEYVDALSKIPSTARAGIEQLDAYGKLVGIVAGAQSSAGGEIAFGLSYLAGIAREARTEAISTADAMKLLGKTGITFKNNFSNLGIDTQTSKLDKAKQKFADFKRSAESLVSTQKSLKDATKDVGKANQELSEKTQAVIDAQAKLDQIARGYGAGSKEATEAEKDLEKAQRDRTRAGFDLEKAQLGVNQAYVDLNSLRADSTASYDQIRNAEIAVEESKLAVKDAQDALTASVKAETDAQTKLNEVTNGAAPSSTTYKDALKQLTDAQKDELDALDRVNDAKQREFELTNKVTEAVLALKQAKKALTPKQIQAAKKVLEDLKKEPTLQTVAPSAAVIAQQNMPDLSGIDFSGINLGAIPMLADGGIVMKPTLALVGESGPEAVVPLSQQRQADNITIHVNAGMGANGTEIGKQIVQELVAYQRRVGALPIKVA